MVDIRKVLDEIELDDPIKNNMLRYTLDDSADSLGKKIKKATKLEFSRLIPTNFDVEKTTKTVENGLLTIRIPVKEEEKPVEIEIQ